MIKNDQKPKLYINMTTKSLSRKQVIIPINNTNKKNFIEESSVHITNMNRAFKNIKTEVMVDFVWTDSNSIIIMTNKVASTLELQTIENYIKNANCINTNRVKIPRLPQSKSYLKIIGIPCLQKNTNTPITSSIVEDIIKKNYIFNNISLASKSCIIKVSPRSNIAIIWVDIWDTQSSSKAKSLINKCFNIGSYTAIVRGANINLGIPQCKNC